MDVANDNPNTASVDPNSNIKKMQLPVRVVMNNKTFTVFGGEDYTTLIVSYNLITTSFGRSLAHKSCFVLKDNDRTSELCPFGFDSGDKEVEEWDYHFNLFKHQCHSEKERVESEMERDIEEKLKDKMRGARQSLLEEQQKSIQKRAMDQDQTEMKNIIKSTNDVAVQAISKELNLEALIQQEETENKKPGVVVIDHMMVLSDKIDTTQEPHFDVSLDINSGRGKIKTIRTKEMCRLMKVVAERLNCFLIVQNQSTIERAGHGDQPMGINAAYGSADFAWFSDYIITVWQPLKRVQSETPITASGWQYSKIREVGLNDLTRTYTRHGLYYDLATGDFRKFTEIEMEEFQKFCERADVLRNADEKKKGIKYEQSPVKSREAFAKLKMIDGGKGNPDGNV